ncbi:MAG TPA: hypothetical protein VFU23_05550 [Gemmatimonadales bacterium]|nr:hypothetical protein [Gemmatimonadales bacterium]
MSKTRLLALLLACVPGAASAQQAPMHADRLIIVTMDGLRWQEVFGGAVRELISADAGGVTDTAGLLRRFLRGSPEARREALMPFLWGTINREGFIRGDSSAGQTVRVTNGKRFSYPGYNELLTGAPDDRIDSNDKVPNPNVSVLEWLNDRSAFRGRVAAFGSWDVLPFILNVSRSGLPANGDGPPVAHPMTSEEHLLNEFAAVLPPYWGNVRFDAVTIEGALHHLKTRKPRVLYVMMGDTDEWAHERRYDLYLDAAHRGDQFLKVLWETVQRMPEYRGRTALLVATDHGRGSGNDWTDHGRDVPASDRIWMAGLTPAGGSRPAVSGGPLTQAQFAATIAALLGLEAQFRKENPAAAHSILTQRP